MQGKKWCDYCRINVPYNKQAIRAHEETQRHKKNKQSQIKFQRHKIRKENKQKKIPNGPIPITSISGNKFVSDTNNTEVVKPAPLSKQLKEQRLQELRRQQEQFKLNVMSKIHSTIAQKTKGIFGAPVEFPKQEELLINRNYIQDTRGNVASDSDQEVKMWRIDICEQTGKPCFVNNITSLKVYQKPVGIILTQEEELEWQQVQKYAELNPKKDEEAQVAIGQWQQVKDQEDIFLVQAVDPQQQQQQKLKEILPKPKSAQQKKLEQIQQMINDGKIKTAQQVFDAMIQNTFSSKQSIKDKNQRLKQLIENNFQQSAPMNTFKQFSGPGETKKTFQVRKKIKTVNLSNEQDFY